MAQARNLTPPKFPNVPTTGDKAWREWATGFQKTAYEWMSTQASNSISSIGTTGKFVWSLSTAISGQPLVDKKIGYLSNATVKIVNVFVSFRTAGDGLGSTKGSVGVYPGANRTGTGILVNLDATSKFGTGTGQVTIGANQPFYISFVDCNLLNDGEVILDFI